MLPVIFFLSLSFTSRAYSVATFFYEPSIPEQHNTPSQIINQEFSEIESLVERAKTEGADLVLFPEISYHFWKVANITHFSETYPQIGSAVCSDDFRSSIQHHSAACLAKNHSIYIALNIPETHSCETRYCSHHLSNSFAIYDHSGVLVGLARKSHPGITHQEPLKNAQPQHPRFHTNLGADFTLFIGYEVLSPHRVQEYTQSNVWLVPSSQQNNLPIYSTGSIYRGLSEYYKKTIISASPNSRTGMGVYKNGRVINWAQTSQDHLIQSFNSDSILPGATHVSINSLNLGQPIAENNTNCYLQYGPLKQIKGSPCKRINVQQQSSIHFAGKITYNVDKGKNLICAVDANFQSASNQTYALILGEVQANIQMETLFCQVIVCNQFPNCSDISSPGQATLTQFKLTIAATYNSTLLSMPSFSTLVRSQGEPVQGMDKLQNSVELRNETAVSELMNAGIMFVSYNSNIVKREKKQEFFSSYVIIGFCIIGVVIGLALLLSCIILLKKVVVNRYMRQNMNTEEDMGESQIELQNRI